MTNAPPDLGAFRTGVVMPLTGLTGDNVGIAPDAAHLDSGGYHVGADDIKRIGKWLSDYSTRQARDKVSGNLSSAMDIGDDWPKGGRPAWLRFNNLLVAQLRARDPELAALRAVNFSPDGTARKRYDSFNPGQGVIDSTDSVYMHTHLEWWRDTAGTPTRARSLARVGQIIAAAIRNVPLEDGMADFDPYGKPRGNDREVGVYAADVWGQEYLGSSPYGPGSPSVRTQQLGRLESMLVAVLKGQGLAQADIDELQARPAYDPAALATALAPLLVGATDEAAVLAVLRSAEGQAALVQAANTAEDS